MVVPVCYFAFTTSHRPVAGVTAGNIDFLPGIKLFATANVLCNNMSATYISQRNNCRIGINQRFIFNFAA